MSTVSDHLASIDDTFDSFRAIHGDESGDLLCNITTLAATAILAADHMQLLALVLRDTLPEPITTAVDRVHTSSMQSVVKGIKGAVLASVMLAPEQSKLTYAIALNQVTRALDAIGRATRAEPDENP